MSETRKYLTSPKQLETVASQLKGHGFDFNPTLPEGHAAAQGFNFTWNITPDETAITITLQSHPFAMGGLFWKQIDSYLHSL